MRTIVSSRSATRPRLAPSIQSRVGGADELRRVDASDAAEQPRRLRLLAARQQRGAHEAADAHRLAVQLTGAAQHHPVERRRAARVGPHAEVAQHLGAGAADVQRPRAPVEAVAVAVVDLGPAAGAVRVEQHHVTSGLGRPRRRSQPGQPGADHGDVEAFLGHGSPPRPPSRRPRPRVCDTPWVAGSLWG